MYREYTKTQTEQAAAGSFRPLTGLVTVWAERPGPLLRGSLKKQLFRDIVLWTEPVLSVPQESEAVLIVPEDTQLTYTALTEMLTRIREGADAATADALFGAEGETEVSSPRPDGSGRPVMVSARFLSETAEREKKTALSADDVLRRVKNENGTALRCPLFLEDRRRALRFSDIFGDGPEKKVLFVSHELTRTGAVVALLQAVRGVKERGMQPAVLCPQDGPAREDFLRAGAAVIVSPGGMFREDLLTLALRCSLVWINTAVCGRAVSALSGAPVPVIWWVHEAAEIYPGIEKDLPGCTAPNVRVFAAGPYAAEMFSRVRPRIPVRTLLYGVEDSGTPEPGTAGEICSFLCVGAVGRRKGQDKVVKAYRLLPDKIREKTRLTFVGAPLEEDIAREVRALEEGMPERVSYPGLLPREKVLELTRGCTYTVCASRDDPMPMVAAEGFSFGKPVILSADTGTAGYVKDGVQGYVFENGSVRQLADCMARAALSGPRYAAQSAESRKLYEELFSLRAFEENLDRLIGETAAEVE